MDAKAFALIRTPPPLELESPIGYLLRLSNANGFPGIRYPVSMLGFSSSYVVTIGWSFAPLQLLLGSQTLPDGFGYKVHRSAKGVVSISGHKVASEHVGFRNARICPQCLVEGAFIRSAWDLKAYVACHRHACMMLKHCTQCGVQLSSFRKALTQCDCGADLREQVTSEASENLVALMEVLWAKVAEDSSVILKAKNERFPVVAMMAMDLDVLCKLIVELTAVSYQMLSGYRPARKNLKVAALIPSVADVLASWPEKFHGFCAEWRSHCESVRKKGLYKFQSCFSWAFITLYKNLKARSLQTEFLLSAILEYGMETWDLSPISVRGRRLRLLDLPPPRYISKLQAAKLASIRPSLMSLRAKAGRIPGRWVGKKSMRRFVVDSVAFREMRFSRHPDVGKPRALRMLGIATGVYNILKRDGDIVALHQGSRVGAITIEDLLAYRNSIVSLSRKSRKNQTLHPLSLFLSGPTPAVAKVDCLRRIRSGEIRVFHKKNKVTFRDLYTPVDLVSATFDSRAPFHLSGRLCQRDLRDAFGLNAPEASAVLCHLATGDLTKLRLTAASAGVIAFLDEFEPVREVARRFGVAPETLHAVVRRQEWKKYLKMLPHRISSRAYRNATFVHKNFASLVKNELWSYLSADGQMRIEV